MLDIFIHINLTYCLSYINILENCYNFYLALFGRYNEKIQFLSLMS